MICTIQNRSRSFKSNLLFRHCFPYPRAVCIMKYGTVQKSYEIAKLLRVMLYEESVYCMRDNDRNTRPYLQIVFYVLTFLGILLCYSQQTLTNLPFLYKILQCVRSAARITISKPCFACNDRNRTLLPGWSLVSAGQH